MSSPRRKLARECDKSKTDTENLLLGLRLNLNHVEDDVFQVIDDLDNTKVVKFQCSGITIANTRILNENRSN